MLVRLNRVPTESPKYPAEEEEESSEDDDDDSVTRLLEAIVLGKETSEEEEKAEDWGREDLGYMRGVWSASVIAVVF